jgi:hypothetical protein
MLLAAVALGRTNFGPIALACLPVSIGVAYRLSRLRTEPRNRQQTVIASAAFGGLVAVGGMAIYLLATMGLALVPGSTVSRPETPLGYLLIFVISMAAMVPIVAIGTTAIGLIWASARLR